MNIVETHRRFRDATMLMTGHTEVVEEKLLLDDLESSDRKFEFRATKKEPDAVLNIREGAALMKVDMSTFAREAVAAALARVKIGLPISGEQSPNLEPRTFTAPMLGSIPCGPWSPSDDSRERFTISTESADELEARDGDWWFRASGDSMMGAGIVDGSLVLVRPYEGKPPRRGDVVAVQIEDEKGDIVGTFKRFDGSHGDVPKLLDGNDEPFELPNGARVAGVLARGVGVVSRL